MQRWVFKQVLDNGLCLTGGIKQVFVLNRLAPTDGLLKPDGVSRQLRHRYMFARGPLMLTMPDKTKGPKLCLRCKRCQNYYCTHFRVPVSVLDSKLTKCEEWRPMKRWWRHENQTELEV